MLPGAWRLTLEQPAAGYRFSLEAFLLADFVPPAAAGPCVDLGTGCGVVALLLARRFPALPLVGVELQASLLALARRNVVANGLAHQVALVQADIRQLHRLFPAGAFRTAVCNPPYRPAGSGRLNPHPEKAIARHELTLTLPQLLQACRHLLAPRGLLVLVYPPARLAELCARLEAAGLRPRRLRLVHATLQEPASLALVEAVRGGRHGLTVLPPLAVYEAAGKYSAEMQAIFHGRGLAAQEQG
ncbi:MAG: SAM-dependent methyltransferase [Candidatus Tectimicrobiota bacterium]|nr:MAG: SAM-dependent methyltransferase [Candidatus Tectomicrobia bacterium]